MAPTWNSLLKSRNDLKRKEQLEKDLRFNRRLVAEANVELNALLAEQRNLEAQLNIYTYSHSSIERLAQIEDALPESSGVYGIFVDNTIVYVGESHNVRGRGISHLRSIIRPSKDAITMYAELSIIDLSRIDIRLLEECADDKKIRLDLEHRHSLEAIAAGCKLYNCRYAYGSTIPCDGEAVIEEHDPLADYGHALSVVSREVLEAALKKRRKK